MTIFVYSICRNRADILPFWLRHYQTFADKIFVWDDHSNDGSRDLLQKHPLVQFNDWPFTTGIDEDKFLEFAYQTYPLSVGLADWVIWVDTDEFIYNYDLKGFLVFNGDVDVIQPEGFNMVNEGMPKDDGRQIWEICPMGVHAPTYNKPVLFRPTAKVRWIRGKHRLENSTAKLRIEPLVKLLHYRYLGYDYTKRRNAENYNRVPGDKAAAWTCAPGYKGEGSPEWSILAIKESFKVIP